MELSRRDAVAALAALGAGGAIYAGYRASSPDDDPELDGGDRPTEEELRAVMVAVAETVYPSDVGGVEAFVGAFLDGRLADQTHREGLEEAVADLQRRAVEWHGAGVASLAVGDRDRLLREVGADTAEEDPEGSAAERIRYYVVNDLLLALFTSPTGGRLVGIENPIGHPGGIESYQRGP